MLVLPAVYQLFGPASGQGNGGWNSGAISQTWNADGSWISPGSAFTPATKMFRFSLGMPFAMRCQWWLEWTPNAGPTSVSGRLIQFDDGPTNIAGLGPQIYGDGTNSPRNMSMDFTAAFNELVRSKVDKNIGYQMWGPSVTSQIYESRLEIDWAIPG